MITAEDNFYVHRYLKRNYKNHSQETKKTALINQH